MDRENFGAKEMFGLSPHGRCMYGRSGQRGEVKLEIFVALKRASPAVATGGFQIS
jgi:hypothetical protein